MTLIQDQHYNEAIAIDAVAEHPDNPNRGDDETVGQSIDVLGFYGGIIVQTATPDGEARNLVIAGNTRWRAMKASGADTIPGHELVCDDDTAKRIMLMDNRSAELATRDPRALLDLLTDLGSSADELLATGYDTDAVDLLLATLDSENDGGIGDLDTDPIDMDTQWQIIVDCDDDTHHRDTIAYLTEQGFRVRASLT